MSIDVDQTDRTVWIDSRGTNYGRAAERLGSFEVVSDRGVAAVYGTSVEAA